MASAADKERRQREREFRAREEAQVERAYQTSRDAIIRAEEKREAARKT